MLICNVKLLTKEEIANKMQWASMTDALDSPRVWPGLARGSGVTENWGGTTAYELLGDGVDFGCFLQNDLRVGGDLEEGAHRTHKHVHVGSNPLEDPAGRSPSGSENVPPYASVTHLQALPGVCPICGVRWLYSYLVP